MRTIDRQHAEGVLEERTRLLFGAPPPPRLAWLPPLVGVLGFAAALALVAVLLEVLVGRPLGPVLFVLSGIVLLAPMFAAVDRIADWVERGPCRGSASGWHCCTCVSAWRDGRRGRPDQLSRRASSCPCGHRRCA